MNWEGIDQRKFPRARYNCVIKLSGHGKEEAIDTRTENIGAGGICVVLDRRFDLFDDVELEISLDKDKNPVQCKGTVVWVVERYSTDKSKQPVYDTGIEFIQISDKERQKIAELVASQLERQA